MSDLKTDESAMTGEIIEIRKSEHAPLLLSGTAVCGGAGTMLVVAVGPHSEWGMTLKHLTEDSDETPLQVRRFCRTIYSFFSLLSVCCTSHSRGSGLSTGAT